ncbi:hypothetical protein [Stutzerimonas xanthomarina]|uniref:hypothetical protein n=1 Tax=Stutzerimonas xanthomarina TaxID=271420 RepID=UPI003AA9A488
MRSLLNYLMALVRVAAYFDRRGGRLFTLAALLLAGSRGMQVAAFFLPIKVLILMASAREPGYYHYLKPYLTLDQLMLGMLLLVPVFYFSYIILGVMHRRVLDADLNRQKTVAFECGALKLKPAQMVSLHRRLAKAYADMWLMLGTLLVITLIQPLLGAAVAALVLFNLLIFDAYAFAANEDKRLTIFRLHRRQFIEYIASSNFLVVFFMLAWGIARLGLDVFSAVLMLLLSRLLFQAMQRFSAESLSLKSDLEKPFS